MKKAGKRILSGILCIVLAFCLYLGSGVQSVNAGIVANNASAETKKTYTEKNEDYETGTAENPFTVLEIVPNHSMAKFGYLIPGCEPIDMNELMNNDTVFGTYESMFARSNNGEETVATIVDLSYKKFADQLPAGATAREPWSYVDEIRSMAPADINWVTQETNYGMWIFRQNTYQETGYYEYVPDGTGYFDLVASASSSTYQENWETDKKVLNGDEEILEVDEKVLEDGQENLEVDEKVLEDGQENLEVDERSRNTSQDKLNAGMESADVQPESEETGTKNGDVQPESEETGTESVDTSQENLDASLDNQVNRQDASAGGYTFVYNAQHRGSYNWVEAENTDGVATDYTADKVWTTRTCNYYFEYKERSITNNDTLIKNVFDTTTEEGFVSQVITLTPEELTTEENLKLIDSADLIVIAEDAETNIRELWNALRDDKDLPEVAANAPTRFNQNDVPYAAVKRIVERMASEDPAALILDKTTYDNAGSTNLKKLSIMLLEYDPALFIDCYFDKIDENGTYTDENGNKHTEWVCSEYPMINTFDLSLAKNKNINLEAGNGVIADNIYAYNGYNVFSHGFEDAKYRETSLNREAFDYFEELYGARPEMLSAREFVQYILSGYNYKTSLRILEVEPTNAYIYPGDDHIATCTDANCADCQAWKEYYRRLFPWMKGDMKTLVNSGRLQIVTMPSWEFIGKIEDLNAEYDMIIFGPNQNAANGVDGYNDKLMNGLIYSSIGDTVLKDESGARQYNDVFDIQSDITLRYSGNDLTEKKFEEVKKFLSGGKPVIVDSKFYKTDYSGTSTDEVNKVTVDENSYAYKLFALAGTEEGTNMFVTDRIDMIGLKALVSKETCEIEFYTADGGTGYPVEYSYETKSDGSINGDTVTYVDSQTFAYQFRINGKSNQTYGVSLYIDRNGDGIYKGSLKENVLTQSEESEEIENLTITDMYGYPVNANNLQEGVWYRVSKKLPENYVGILPWKLEVYDTMNPMIRDNVVKYSAIKTTKENREQIRVLQMNLTPTMTKSDKTGVIMATVGFENDQNAQKFRKYINAVNDFEVTVEFMENQTWVSLFNTTRQNGESDEAYQKRQEQKIEEWKSYLDNYDMLMIGFQDIACFTSNEIYQAGFEYFVEQGKSVILSHDLAKDESYKYLYSSYVSTYDDTLRSLLRQRRYNTGSVLMQGREIKLYSGNGTDVRGNLGKWVISSLTTTNEEGELIPNYGDNSTDLFIKYGGPWSWGNNAGAKADRDTDMDAWFPLRTSYVNINNSGQITNYPYDIPDVIEVAKTHNQYSQLNLDDEDMVVWYSLTDEYSKTYADDIVNKLGGKDYRSDATVLGRGVYSSRESDVRNSYYIYNVGNITYTGMGHSGYDGCDPSKDSTVLPDDEVKLFVNTMISAYRATTEKPYIEVTNEDKIENSKDDVYLYVSMDEENFDYTNDSLQVEFKVTDPSWLQTEEKETYMQFCTDLTGTELAEQETLYTAGTTDVVGISEVASSGSYVYLRKPDGWGNNISCFVYSATNESIQNAAWPGVAMENLGGGLYRYKIPSAIISPRVMFTDGGNQYPSANAAGLGFSNTSMLADGANGWSWTAYEEKQEQAYKVQIDGSYYFNVSYQDLIEKGQLEYYLCLKSVTKKNGKTTTNREVTKVTVLPMPLFDLN